MTDPTEFMKNILVIINRDGQGFSSVQSGYLLHLKTYIGRDSMDPLSISHTRPSTQQFYFRLQVSIVKIHSQPLYSPPPSFVLESREVSTYLFEIEVVSCPPSPSPFLSELREMSHTVQYVCVYLSRKTTTYDT